MLNFRPFSEPRSTSYFPYNPNMLCKNYKGNFSRVDLLPNTISDGELGNWLVFYHLILQIMITDVNATVQAWQKFANLILHHLS